MFKGNRLEEDKERYEKSTKEAIVLAQGGDHGGLDHSHGCGNREGCSGSHTGRLEGRCLRPGHAPHLLPLTNKDTPVPATDFPL